MGTLVEIQDIRDGTITNDTVVTVEKVFVTGVGQTSTGNVTTLAVLSTTSSSTWYP